MTPDPAAEAIALAEAGRLPEAEAACRRAMKARPGRADLMVLLARILFAQGRAAEAARELDKAALARQKDAVPWGFAGVVYERAGDDAKAEKAYRHAVRISPAAPLWFNLGNVLRRRNEPAESLAAYAEAHRLAPGDPKILGALVARKQALCDWDGLDALSAALAALVVRGGAGAQPLRMLAIDGCSEAAHQICAREWSARVRPTPRTFPPPAAKQRLTLGYLSADFHRHATAWLAAELFERHDRERFEVIAYSLGPNDGSPIRHRLEAGFDRFHHLAEASSAAVADQILADGVDILIDLKGHTRDARLDVLAARPAPIQVNYLGYPGTMGAPYIDYILADPVVLPFSQQGFYDEAIVHLPDCYQINDRQRPIPPALPRAAHGLPDTGAVLACFNALYKITPAVFARWTRILAAVPDSVLWLLAGEAAAESNLRRAAAGSGLDPARLVFARPVPLDEHLARYHAADLFLDTRPYNAHTTGSDALWMGCPLLTWPGESFASRVGASLTKAAGLPEMIAADGEEYEAKAIALVRDPARLAALRQKLQQGRFTNRLFDTPRFVAGVEAAYQTMWARYASGSKPEAFAVAEI